MSGRQRARRLACVLPLGVFALVYGPGGGDASGSPPPAATMSFVMPSGPGPQPPPTAPPPAQSAPPDPPRAPHPQHGPEGGSCGKHFVAPFDGHLTLRSAYRGGKPGAFQFCPQWSSFGGNLRGARNHWGIDVSAPTGTPVRAAVEGVLSYARDPGGYGLFARVRFSSAVRGKDGSCGKAEEHEIIYGHLIDDNPKLAMGPRPVHPGEIVGRVGCTGNARGMCSPSPESHLHVTVQRTHGPKVRVDPSTFLGWNVGMPRDAERPAEWGHCGRPSPHGHGAPVLLASKK